MMKSAVPVLLLALIVASGYLF
ncbi:MAG: hypothetical protein JWP08_615, partial [Bryobacterales bacterium]|nr:hypothetical protein [Bryobacterales bacterium]